MSDAVEPNPEKVSGLSDATRADDGIEYGSVVDHDDPFGLSLDNDKPAEPAAHSPINLNNAPPNVAQTNHDVDTSNVRKSFAEKNPRAAYGLGGAGCVLGAVGTAITGVLFGGIGGGIAAVLGGLKGAAGYAGDKIADLFRREKSTDTLSRRMKMGSARATLWVWTPMTKCYQFQKGSYKMWSKADQTLDKAKLDKTTEDEYDFPPDTTSIWKGIGRKIENAHAIVKIAAST